MPRTPLDITHVLAPTRAGGLERVVEMLAAGHAARGHHVSAVALLPASAAEPPVTERLARAGVAVRVIRVAGRAYATERREFSQLLAHGHPGVVHTHGYRADVVYGSVAASLGFPVVTTLHGFTGGDLKNRLYEYLQRRACRRFDRVVAVSRPIAEQMARSGIHQERLRLIPNAYTNTETLSGRLDARKRLGLDADRYVIGWVGRLSREKGADILVRAVAHLGDLPITVAVVGLGPELDASRALAQSLHVDHLFHWAGPVDGMNTMFGAFDLLTLSSRTEGTPIVLFEAMAAGVPIVTTSVGGIPDVLTPAEAMLVPPEAPEQLAAAMRAAFENRDAARVRADRAAAVLRERFAPEPWLGRYETVYEEALQSASSRAQR